MSEKLPNWNLKDFYSNIKDEQINFDLDTFRKFSESFNKSTKKISRKIQKILSL